MIYQDVVGLLGKTVRDKVTKCTGAVTSVAFDVYGCIQVVIQPVKLNKEGAPQNSFGWFDVNRVELVKEKRIIEPLDFEKNYPSFKDVHGPADKPAV